MSLVRVGSTTHTVNTDQRRLVLEFTAIADGLADCRATLPGNPGVLVPGYWMLFAVDTAGVPSERVFVLILPAY